MREELKKQKQKDRVLFIRFSSIGDIVLTFPVLAAYRERYPQREIHFVTKESFRPLVAAHPAVDFVWSLWHEEHPAEGVFKKLTHLARNLKRTGFSEIYDLHGSQRSRLLYFLLLFCGAGCRPPRSRLKKPYWRRWLLVYFKINLFKNFRPLPMVERYARVAGLKLGADSAWNFPVDARARAAAGEALEGKQDRRTAPPVISLMVGSTWATKAWPREHYAGLMERLHREFPDIHFCLLGGSADREVAADILARLPAQMAGRLFDLTGKLDLFTSAAVIDQSRVFLTNDTGLLHVACGLTTPTLALFGCTVEEWGFYPYQEHVTVLEKEDLSCRPCTTKGRAKCPLRDPARQMACLREISPEVVAGKILAVLKNQP